MIMNHLTGKYPMLNVSAITFFWNPHEFLSNWVLTQFAQEHEADSLWEVFIVEMAHDPTNVHYAASILALINCLMDSYDINERLASRKIIDGTPLNSIINRINEHIAEHKDEYLNEHSEVLELYGNELEKFNDSRDMDDRAVTYNNLNLS